MRPHAVLTGGAGFLGSHIAERLLDQEVDVTVLDNFSTGSPDNVAQLFGRNGFRLIELDVTNYISAPGPVDYVLHFASPASPIDYAELPVQTMKVGSLGTLNTLGLVMEKGARARQSHSGRPKLPAGSQLRRHGAETCRFRLVSTSPFADRR